MRVFRVGLDRAWWCSGCWFSAWSWRLGGHNQRRLSQRERSRRRQPKKLHRRV